MRTSRVVPVLTLLSLAGCAHAPAAPERSGPTAADFYPLEVGNSWTYDENRLGEKRQVDIKVLRAGEAGGFVVSDGDELRVDSYGVRDGKRYRLRNPIEVGTKWTAVLSAQSVEHYEIIAANEPCDAPAGSFTGCITVRGTTRVMAPGPDRSKDPLMVNEATYAPGVGIVRLSIVIDANGKIIPQYSSVLTKYAFARPGAQNP